jgi:hypothetical protein
MSGEGFLSRWSRRKVEAETRPRDEQAPPPPMTEGTEELPSQVPPPDRAEERPAEAPPITEEEPLDLPDIDSLTKESDYTVFLKEKVPAALRKQALRKLWLSDPVLANLDGLNDYDEDYSTPAITGSAVKTAYNVLRGYARPEEEADAQTAEAGITGEGEAAPDDLAVSETPEDSENASSTERTLAPAPEAESVTSGDSGNEGKEGGKA